jgi:hypothetical protein
MSRAIQLGELLAGEAASADLTAWLAAQDKSLISCIEREAGLRRESVAQFLRIAASDFFAEADQEDWTSLMSAMRDAEDPGAACVARVVAFRLKLERAA